MESFCRMHLRLSPGRYRDMKILRSNPPSYDIYLAGSDQIWNPTTVSYDSSYLFTFAPPGRRLISYGASFGVSRLSNKYVDAYIEPLKGIDFLSVQELEGKDMVTKLGKVELHVSRVDQGEGNNVIFASSLRTSW